MAAGMIDWDLVRPLLAGLAGGLGAALIGRLSLRRAVPDRLGWHHVRPGAMHWTALVLGAALLALMVYVRLFVGSDRADAAFQMRVLSLMIACLGALVAMTGWQVAAILRARLHWRDDAVAREGPGGALELHAMADVTAVRPSWTGAVTITFADGTALKLDHYATTVPALCERAAEVVATR